MARKNSLPRPTAEYITGRIDELKKEYSSDRECLERIRTMRDLSWEVNVPERLQKVTDATGLEYRDATIASELLELPRLYLAKEPQLQLRVGKEKKDSGSLTTRLEYFITAALFEDCGRRGTGPSTLHRMVDACFEGGGWTKLVKAEDEWDEYNNAELDDYEDGKPGVDAKDGRTKHERYDRATEEMKKKAGVPIHWKHVDTMNAYPIFSGDRLTGFIEVQKRSLSTCARDYGFGMNEAGEICPARTAVKDWSRNVDAGATVELIMYRDADWMSYLVRYEGTYRGTSNGSVSTVYEVPKFTRRHRYNLGHPGVYSALGWTKNYEYARVATWSASEPKRYLVQYLSWLRSIYAYIAVFQAIPPVFEEMPLDGAVMLEGDGKTPKGPEIYEGGMRYTGQPGQRMTPVIFPSAAEHLQAEIVQTQQDIGRHSQARKSGELGDLGGEGFALSTVFEKDRARYGAFEDAILQHLTQVSVDFCKLVEQIDEPVYVFRNAKKDGGYIEAKPADFETAFKPTWTLYVDSTAANIIKQRYAEAMQKAGYFSHQMAVEFMGLNWDEVRVGLAEDRVSATEAYQKGEEAEVWAGMGTGAWADKQALAQRIGALGAQGAPQAPAPGGGGLPGDQASMAMSPNQAGVAPGPELRPGGMPASPAVQTAGATAAVGGGQIG